MIRPVDAAVSQAFGANPTSTILPGSADYWIIEQFGNYQPDGHTGEDYAVPVGTPIRAVTSGTVIHIGNRGGTYLDNEFWIAPAFAGYHYVINHDPAPGFPNGFIGIYAHGKDGGARVKAGQRVSEGQVIGLSGNTGGSTGPHVHFEILPDQFVVNSHMYGRVDPELLFTAGGAAIGTQGATITPIKEDTLSAAEKNEIIAAMKAEGQKTRDYIGQLLVSGYTVGGKQFPGDNMVNITTQNRVNALLNLIKAMAANPNLTPEQVTAAVREGLAEGIVTVDVNVAGGK